MAGWTYALPALELAAIALAVRSRGRLRAVIATELALIGWAVTGWRTPRRAPELFTVHREAGWSSICGVFVALSLVEIPCLHLVVAIVGSTTAAWVVTALSVYGVVWLIGDAHALRHGGIRVDADALDIRVGVRWQGRVPYGTIARVAPANAPPPGAIRAGVAITTVVLELTEPVTLVGLLGRRRSARAVALSVDDVPGFEAAVEAAASPR
jgi:hypothetical protein